MAKTTTTTDMTTTATETKAVLTEDAKRQKRNEYARAYYQAHKEQMKAAVKKCQAKKTNAEDKKPAARGKAHHAICQAKKACKATPEQKHLAKLQRLLKKSESKYLAIKEKLATQKAEVAKIKVEVAEAKALVKACKAANKAANADHRKQRGRTAPNAVQQA